MPVTYYVAMPFVRNEDGELVAGEAQDRQSATAAESLARRMSETSAGAVAFSRTGEPATVQAYDDALTMQAQARQQNLVPLERGPLGQVRDAATTQSAYGALMPDKPLSGGHTEIGDAVARLAQRDPATIAALVRQGLSDRADATMGRTAAGDNPNGGALFAKSVAGTDQKRANLAAALGALPNSAPAKQSLNDLIDVFQATGKRRNAGSNTSGDTEIRRDMGTLPLGVAAAEAPLSVGSSLLGKIRDEGARYWLNRRAGTLADLFVDPNSVDRIAAMRASYNEQPFFAAAARTGLTLGSLYGSN